MELKNTIELSTQENTKKNSLAEVIEKLPSELVTKEDYAKICYLYLKASNTHLTELELQQFIMMCYQSKLNPFKREAYAIKYGNKPFQVVTGYQVYIERAEKTGLLDWWEVEIIEEPIIYSETGKIQNPNRKPYRAIFHGKRKDSSKDIKFSYKFQEWYLGENQGLWGKKPEFMLEKVAISNSFRRWFSTELSGLPYTIEENWNNLEEANKQIEAQNKVIDEIEEEQKKEIVNAF